MSQEMEFKNIVAQYAQVSHPHEQRKISHTRNLPSGRFLVR